MIRTLLFAAVLFAAVLFAAPVAARAADLWVTIDGVRNSVGAVYVCLWTEALTYPDCAKSVPRDRRALSPEGGRARTLFTGLAPGTYAISVMHDENGNGVMDTNFLGFPREGFGFSNVPRLTGMSAPTFEEASFRVDGDATLVVTMIYL
jgi:uncharacterized protein (DUF2141 family)